MRHPLHSSAGLLFTAFTALLATGALTTPAHAAGARYVALGDSYSAGDGAGDYSSGSGSCLRSPHAYGPLWASANAATAFTFSACSGATTTDVRTGQLGALNASTTLVTVTAGGNDIGFSSVMETCVLGSDSSCVSAVNQARRLATTALPAALASMYGAIRTAAPNAHVVVLDYPHLYVITSFCIGLGNTKRAALNGGADTLDTVIAKAAADAGLTFADVRPRFAGHELCSGDGWLHSVTIPIGESYHPTAKGQANGYLPVLTAAA